MAAKKTELRPVIVCTDYKGVFFGYAADTTGDVIHLKDARMAIYWGTTKGIGQLALEGPQSTTKIDEAGTVTVPRTAIIALIDVVEAKWPGR